MKTKTLFSLVCIFSFFIAGAQNEYIIAGEYDSSMTYFDIPNTILINDHPNSTEYFDFDLNIDGIVDYQFAISFYISPSGGGGISIVINSFNDNEVSFYRIDSNYASIDSNSYIYRKIAKPFEQGEIINNSCSFDTTSIYIDGSAGAPNGFPPMFWEYSIHDWRDLGDRCLGFRMNINDTVTYGWMKIQLLSSIEIVVEEYALSKKINSNNIIEQNKKTHTKLLLFPNPSNDYISIQLTNEEKISDISIIDIYGKIIYISVNNNFENKRISISHLAKGAYLMKVSNSENCYYSKFLKE